MEPDTPSDVDQDPHGSALRETSWIRIRIDDLDPVPGGKKSPKMRQKVPKTPRRNN